MGKLIFIILFTVNSYATSYYTDNDIEYGYGFVYDKKDNKLTGHLIDLYSNGKRKNLVLLKKY